MGENYGSILIVVFVSVPTAVLLCCVAKKNSNVMKDRWNLLYLNCGNSLLI